MIECCGIGLITYVLIVLHRVDGGEVIVAPTQVTSLRSPGGPLDHLPTPGGRCLVGMTDGKFVSVLESCRRVKDLIERQLKASE